MSTRKILVVDDDIAIVTALTMLLKREGYQADSARDGLTAFAMLTSDRYDMLITDIYMTREMDGLELLRRAKELQESLAVLMITGNADMDTALKAMELGAFDYIQKPFNISEIILTVERAIAYESVSAENEALKEAMRSRYHAAQVIGQSPQIQRVYELISQAALMNRNVLLLGESGTGKSFYARAIHYASTNMASPFVHFHCPIYTADQLREELFGSLESPKDSGQLSMTTLRRGAIREANCGALYLDEIGVLPLDVQGLLTQALQEGRFRRTGCDYGVALDLRILASTVEDLNERAKQGLFRRELLDALNFAPILLPPLRERTEDIPLLAHHFIRVYNEEQDRGLRLNTSAVQYLRNYSWPGNVRELRNMMFRAAQDCEGDVVGAENLPQAIRMCQAPETQLDRDKRHIGDFRWKSLKAYLRDKEREYVRQILQIVENDEAQAAERLGVSLKTFKRKYGDLS